MMMMMMMDIERHGRPGAKMSRVGREGEASGTVGVVLGIKEKDWGPRPGRRMAGRGPWPRSFQDAS